MSLWLDFMGAEVRFVSLPGFGKTRIAEAGKENPETLILMHGIGGHLEAYAKNVVELGKHYHVIAFDYVGHGLSEKRTDITYQISDYVEQLRELMDLFDIDAAHISGESLGGVVTGVFATTYPDRIKKAILNTTGGIPIVTEKGRQDLKELGELSAKSSGQKPSFETVLDRMKWLLFEDNWDLLTDELVNSRLAIYSTDEFQKSAPLVYSRLKKVNQEGAKPDMIDLDKVECETLLFWTTNNPIHDVQAAEAALPHLKKGQLYVMKKPAGHWPQYECPEEFNRVVVRFLTEGRVN